MSKAMFSFFWWGNDLCFFLFFFVITETSVNAIVWTNDDLLDWLIDQVHQHYSHPLRDRGASKTWYEIIRWFDDGLGEGNLFLSEASMLCLI